ncbi:hypothetical protein J2T16_005205 [Paenibacillus intestini]|nr:hypothetical protein [Paenibacillus intestini]
MPKRSSNISRSKHTENEQKLRHNVDQTEYSNYQIETNAGPEVSNTVVSRNEKRKLMKSRA